MPDLRTLLACFAVGCATSTGPLAAQSPKAPPGPTPMQQLIDEFIGIMPRNPTELRKVEVRSELSPKALPVLRRIRTFAAEHTDSMLARRVHEFTIYSLVLDEPGLRGSFDKQGDADRDAQLLLGTADAIRATDPDRRLQAIAGVARALRPRAAEATAQPKSAVAACAVQCLAVAAGLTGEEARLLAESTDDEDLARQLLSVAESAERDPRRLLDKPFAIDGKLIDGTSFSTRSLRGKVVLVEFWASWCGPCIKALPELVALRRKYGDRGFEIVAVNCDRERQALAAFLADHPEVDWPQLVAGKDMGWHPIATELGVASIPRLFLVDRRGVLRSVDAKDGLEALLVRLLAE